MNRSTVFLVPFVSMFAAAATAGAVYVDNIAGDDRNDGRGPAVTGLHHGPVRSLERASRLIGVGDRVEIAETGVPYYGTLSLVGVRGVPDRPLIVEGHGATFDGSEPADPAAWRPLKDDLWTLAPERKGWFQLVREGAAVPEVAADPHAALPTLPPAHWAAWRGAIYYQAEPDELPPLEPFRLATREAGVFVYDARLVVVRDLTLQHYRLDGVNVADRAADVAFQNVDAHSNGRSGFFVGGASRVLILGGSTRNNRQASLLLRGVGTADVRDTNLDAEPTLVE